MTMNVQITDKLALEFLKKLKNPTKAINQILNQTARIFDSIESTTDEKRELISLISEKITKSQSEMVNILHNSTTNIIDKLNTQHTDTIVNQFGELKIALKTKGIPPELLNQLNTIESNLTELQKYDLKISTKIQEIAIELPKIIERNLANVATNITKMGGSDPGSIEHTVKSAVANQFSTLMTYLESAGINVSSKGKVAEKILAANLESLLVGSSVEETANTAKSGDYMVEYENIKFLLESKYYSKNVPTPQINKFLGDLKLSEAHIGILVSCNSGIVKRKEFTIEKTSGGKFAVYIPNANTDARSTAWVIRVLAKKLDSPDDEKDEIDTQQYQLLFKEMESKVKTLKSRFSRFISDLEKTITKHKNLMSDTINTIESQLLDNIE